MHAPLVIASVLASWTLASGIARADKPTLVALAPARDARKAVAIGPAGQVYQPDGKGAWVRTQAGGVAEELVSASTIGTTVIAGAKGAPPFKLKGGAWTALNLGLKVKATIGNGSRPLAIVGTSVFALDKRQPVKLPNVPTTVTSVMAAGASARGVVIATDQGLLRLAGKIFKPLAKAPKTVRMLIDDRWALVDRGALDLKTMKPFVWPAGVQIVEATTIGNDFVGVSMHGKTIELITIKAGKVARETVPIDNAKPVVGVVVDKQARVAIALRDGRIALREKGTWTVSEVREELAAPKPGPEPAESP
ncbi:MAG TPA: hypothetical protein VFV99_33285 [Kofleriaceae bacterium]|nr:hypothetical protein [Kofleriaceae bacterium]